MNHKRAIIPATIAITIGAWAGGAAAHRATVTPTCGGLAWVVTNYDKTVVNTITVTVDGGVVWQDNDFKSSDEGNHPWNPATAHTWAVMVDAPGTQWDRSFAGTQAACVVPTTTVTSVTPSTSEVPVTTVPITELTTTTTTTTTTVATGLPPVPTTVATDVVVLIPEPVLPRTGGDPVLIVAAAVLLGLGGLLALVARRRGAVTRQEHLDWCKQRALAYIDAGEINNAFASMCSDLNKENETANHAAIQLGIGLLVIGQLTTASEMRRFIEGFN